MHPKLWLSVPIMLIAFTSASDASFWDSIPLVSQLKSMVQAASGDREGARQTQENFVNQAPLLSQFKSLVQVASGDNMGALRTQEKFLHGFVEPVADNTPVVGHIKGAIHMAAGDQDRGEQIIKGATTSTAAILGGIIGGPPGVIAAGAASDGIITGLDSAANQEYKPFGVVDYVSNIDKQTPGDHFDALMDVGAPIVNAKIVKVVDKVTDNALTSDLGKL